jgi:hypothetical protein
LKLSDPVAWEWVGYTNLGPYPRSGAVAVYDAPAHGMVVFGGELDGHDMSDTWRLALDDDTWAAGFSGTPPTKGYGASAAFDALRRRMLVIAAFDSLMYQIDLATKVWSVVTTGPCPERGLGTRPIAYDIPRDRLILRAGGTWELNLSGTPTWTQLVTGGTPPPDARGTVLYDAPRDRMLQVRDDGTVWALSLDGQPTWTSIANPPLPTGTHVTRVVHDLAHDRLVFFGGDPENDTWAFDLASSTWSLLVPGSPIPKVESPTAVVVRPWDAMVILASAVWRFPMSGTGVFQEVTTAGTGPAATSGNAAIYDPVRDRMIVFSGNQVYALSTGATPTWSLLTPTGTPPPSRTAAHAIYDPIRDRMVVFGGNAGTPLMDTWALSLSGTPEWSQLAPGSALPQLSTNVLVYDSRRDSVVVIGTHDSGSFTASYWMPLDAPGTWTSLGVLPSRQFFAAEYDSMADRVRLFGGKAIPPSISVTDELLEMRPDGAWIQTPAGSMKPLPGYGQTLIRDPARNRLVMFGGRETFASAPVPQPTWSCSEVWFAVPTSLVGVNPRSRSAGGALAFRRLWLAATDHIAFELDGLGDGAAVVEVFDVSGRRLGAATVPAGGPGSGSGTVALGSAARSGIVLVRVRQNELAAVRRFAVLR